MYGYDRKKNVGLMLKRIKGKIKYIKHLFLL